MDFSEYGGASDEWLAVQATLPTSMLPTTPTTVLEQRALGNEAREAAAARGFALLADQVERTDVAIPARDGSVLAGRLFWPHTVAKTTSPALFMHLHGGGFLVGTPDSEDDVCAKTAIHATAKAQTQTANAGAGVVVLNVNYRHTPEHTYPTQWHDVQDAFAWVHAVAVPTFGVDATRVVVGGVSAGAQMAASLALEQCLGRLPGSDSRPLPPIAGLVLMIPPTVHLDSYAPQMARMASPKVSSMVENCDAPLLSLASMRFYTDLLVAGTLPEERARVHDTMLSPGNATVDEVRGLPPVVFGVCGLDPLRDEGLLFAQRLAEASVPTDVHVFQGVPHGFHRFECISLCADWDAVIEDGILWTVSQPAAAPFSVTVHVQH